MEIYSLQYPIYNGSSRLNMASYWKRLASFWKTLASFGSSLVSYWTNLASQMRLKSSSLAQKQRISLFCTKKPEPFREFGDCLLCRGMFDSGRMPELPQVTFGNGVDDRFFGFAGHEGDEGFLTLRVSFAVAHAELSKIGNCFSVRAG